MQLISVAFFSKRVLEAGAAESYRMVKVGIHYPAIGAFRALQVPAGFVVVLALLEAAVFMRPKTRLFALGIFTVMSLMSCVESFVPLKGDDLTLCLGADNCFQPATVRNSNRLTLTILMLKFFFTAVLFSGRMVMISLPARLELQNPRLNAEPVTPAHAQSLARSTMASTPSTVPMSPLALTAKPQPLPPTSRGSLVESPTSIPMSSLEDPRHQ